MSDKQIVELLLNNETQALLEEGSLNAKNQSDFLIIIKNILVKKPWDVVLILFYFLDHLSIIDYSSWERIILEIAKKEDKYMMGSINLIDFFYKYVGIDFLWLYSHTEQLDQDKQKHVFDYYTGVPGLLRIKETTYLKMLQHYNVRNENLEKIQFKLQLIQNNLIKSGAKKAEVLVEDNYFMPNWCKDLDV